MVNSGTAKTPDVHLGSPERFGYSWERFDAPTEDQRRQFDDWTCLIGADGWRGKTFLDVGCGAGRNSLWALSYGAASGVSIDLDERSLRSATRNLESRPVEVRRQSAYEIPDSNRFDIAFSIGVIHHLDRPDVALRNMVRATKPGGQVMIWVYGRENLGLYLATVDPLRRLLFSRMPLPMVWHLSTVLTALVWCGLRLGITPIDYLRQARRFSFTHLRHIIFDQMIPRVANYWRRDEVESLLRDAGLQDIRLEWIRQMSWCAVGRKPGP